MRNATLMAVAPNANIGLVVGTTPGIDARFAQVFSRNKISGKYMDLNHNLVKDLKNMGIWEKVKEAIIENQGDIANIPGIPQHTKDIYKTAFTTSPLAYVEVAARAQKWVDQALSRNMYLETRDIDETMDIYTTAWKKGLKSTYYLHMKPRHTAEQSTTKINKAEKMGKRGFGSVAMAKKEETVESVLQAQAPIESPIKVTVPTPVYKQEIREEVREAATIQQTMPLTVSMPKVETLKVEALKVETVKVETPAALSREDIMAQLSKNPNVQSTAPAKIKPKVCPIDPAELAQCESCQ
jgi:ribonucleoside-diphosphate reductase alpha chain